MPPHATLVIARTGLFAGLTAAATPAAAMRPDTLHLDDPDPSQLCRAAIAATERMSGIPDEFLSAMGRVESGRPAGGALAPWPWPWTVNAAGAGHVYPSKQAAVDAVRQFLASGVKSLDVGCLQVNLFYHPDAFPSLEQAFDPPANAAYAGQLLRDLFRSTGSWPRAAAAYHSLTPALGSAYLQKVLEEWALPDRAGPADSLGHDKPGVRPTHAMPHAADVASAMSAPPVVESGIPGPPPAFGFSRRFMLPQGQPHGSAATGRSLAAYRAMPVQIALRQPGPIRTP
jgi:hypothetical protein